MNKKEVIKKLGEVTNLSEEKCIIINDILEEHFIIGSGIKDKLKHPFCQLQLSAFMII